MRVEAGPTAAIFPFSITTTPFAMVGEEMGWTSPPRNATTDDCAPAGFASSEQLQKTKHTTIPRAPGAGHLGIWSSLEEPRTRGILCSAKGRIERCGGRCGGERGAEGPAPALHALFQCDGAIAVGAGPGLAPVL